MAIPSAPARIRLRSLPAAAGLFWIRRGFRTFWRRPLGFFGLYLLVVAMLSVAVIVSPLAPLVMILLLPMLSLGFMSATEDVLNDQPLRPSVFWAPLMITPPARRALLAIGLIYVVASVGLALLANVLDGGEAERWMGTLMTPRADGKMPEVPPLSALGVAVLLFKMFGVALVSIPLWHAPALVHWGRQGVAQAMFSSVVAIWRTRAALAVFGLGWFALSFALASVLGVLELVLGSSTILLGFAVLMSWALSALFYVTLWFGFVDTFEITSPVAFRTVLADNEPPAA